jgi:hypothetical protein
MGLIIEAAVVLAGVAALGVAIYRNDPPPTEGEWHDRVARIRADRNRYVWRDGRAVHTAGYEGRHRA